MEYVPPPSSSLVARKKLRPVPPHIKREAESERTTKVVSGMMTLRSQRVEVTALGAAGPERRRLAHPEKGDGFRRRLAESPLRRPVSVRGEDAAAAARRLPLALAVTPQAKRLHRKLLVRQAKRQRGLPLLDIDRAVSATLSLVGGIYGAQEAGTVMGGGAMGKYCTNSQELRILDRFQYPDFSVVVLYKKVVVGFGFMVPGRQVQRGLHLLPAGPPEWRRAGIGTFMIYHLIQKFGFKAEEYILDFYDKYYPVDSTECRHAFFLRLRR
ncbi:hypothetical protein INR49_008130 [Caranx melampygus]|nr:hypothetical protein INR49_008130 [Caranx melampygus]